MRALAVILVCVSSGAFAEKSVAAKTEQTLRTHCLLSAADPKNPWALAHGITALGPSFSASDGRKASDVIVKDFVRKSAEPASGAYVFERYLQDKTPIDPHANLLTKTLVLAGIKDGASWETPLGKLTLADLVKSAEHGFRHVPQNELYWQDVGWTLDLFAARRTPKSATFKDGAGATVDLNAVMNDALVYLELAQKDLADGMDKGLASVPKRKQGIYAHACGGLHLFQGVAHWARHPEVKKAWGKRFDRQVDVLFYRLGSEQRQYDAAGLQVQQMPQYRLALAVQRMKFYGHFLETTGRLRKQNGFKPDGKQKLAIDRAKALLAQAVVDLEALNAWARLPELKQSQPQLYLDLIGDACHAANGLAMWK